MDSIQVSGDYYAQTLAAMAVDLCARYLAAWGYTVVGFPDAPLSERETFALCPARLAFQRLAALSGGDIVVDNARRILYCAVEHAPDEESHAR